MMYTFYFLLCLIISNLLLKKERSLKSENYFFQIQTQKTFVAMMRAVTIVSVVTVQEGNAMETAETAIVEAAIVKKDKV